MQSSEQLGFLSTSGAACFCALGERAVEHETVEGAVGDGGPVDPLGKPPPEAAFVELQRQDLAAREGREAAGNRPRDERVVVQPDHLQLGQGGKDVVWDGARELCAHEAERDQGGEVDERGRAGRACDLLHGMKTSANAPAGVRKKKKRSNAITFVAALIAGECAREAGLCVWRSWGRT